MKKSFKIYFIFVACLVFCISTIRAFYMQITVDEAITYLSFVKGKWSLATELLANNHFLNTLFIMIITFITKVSFNEFIIRIPNLAFYIIYIIYVYKLSCLYKHSGMVATILLLNYSVNEFASLARGYGIASALVVLGLYYYKLYLKDNQIRNLKISILQLILSCFASTTNLILLGSFLLDFIIRIIKKGELKSFISKHKKYLCCITILLFSILFYHFYVSFHDQYLGMCNKDFFSCIIYSPVVYYGAEFMFHPIIVIIMIVVSIFVILFNRKRITFSKDNICYITLSIYFLLIICKLIFPFNFPPNRTFIPFLSVYLISMVDFVSLFPDRYFFRYCSLGVIIICFISFVKNLNVHYVREWKVKNELKYFVEEKYRKKEMISLSGIKHESYISLLFYYEKYKQLYSYSLISADDYYTILHESQVHPITS